MTDAPSVEKKADDVAAASLMDAQAAEQARGASEDAAKVSVEHAHAAMEAAGEARAIWKDVIIIFCVIVALCVVGALLLPYFRRRTE